MPMSNRDHVSVPRFFLDNFAGVSVELADETSDVCLLSQRLVV